MPKPNGDAAFDSVYGFLRNDCDFQEMLIPYNPRNESSLKQVGYTEFGKGAIRANQVVLSKSPHGEQLYFFIAKTDIL